MRKYILLFLAIVTTANAQKHELGKVTIEELKEKVCPKDSAAAAAILFEKGKTFFVYSQTDGFKLKTEVEMKIKIYKKEGYEWANKSIKHYIGSNPNEAIEYSKAVTYNLVNGQIEKTKLKSEGEFEEKANKYWALKKITLPNVKEGSILEYKYVIESPFISSFPIWEFQKSIPVVYSEYRTEIPEYYIYNSTIKGFLTPLVKQESTSKTINLDSKAIVRVGVAMKYEHSSENINYLENQTTYIIENAPALNDESFVNNIKNYTSSVEFELSGKKMPQSAYESIANSWEDVVKKIYDNEDFGPQLKKDNYFEDDIKVLIAGETMTQNEKIMVLFNYVKSHMNWNNYYGYSCNEGVKKAYQDKTGNIAEINLMLVAMLRYAGINANPVLLSTRDNGISIYPSRTSFNYVIAAVEIENDLILLDATNKNTSPNIIPIRALNWFGRIIRKEGSSNEVDLMPKFISKENINAIFDLSKEGAISGKIKKQYTDYAAYSFREKYADIKKESYLEKLEKNYNNIEISEYSVINIDSLQNPITEMFSFKGANSVEIIGGKMYFSPLFFFAENNNPFKREKREYPVDFVYPTEDKYIFSINIPEGYTIESLPKPISLSMNENIANLKFLITNSDTQIQVSCSFKINTSVVSSEYHDELKTFFSEVIKKENEKIVLKKN